MPTKSLEPSDEQIRAGQIVYMEGEAIRLMRDTYGVNEVSLNRANYWAVHLAVMRLERRIIVLEDTIHGLLKELLTLNKKLKG